MQGHELAVHFQSIYMITMRRFRNGHPRAQDPAMVPSSLGITVNYYEDGILKSAREVISWNELAILLQPKTEVVPLLKEQAA